MPADAMTGEYCRKYAKLDAIGSVICGVERGDMLQMHEYNAAVNVEEGLEKSESDSERLCEESESADLLIFLFLIVIFFLVIIILVVFSYVSNDIGATAITLT